MSALEGAQANIHEAELVAARAWLAAGEESHARYFARRLADDTGAAESARMVALEILDETTKTSRSQAPPPLKASARKKPPVPEPPPSEPPLEVKAFVVEPTRAFKEAPAGASLPPIDAYAERPEARQPRHERRGQAGLVRVGPPVRYEAELVESLALPHGVSEDLLPVGHAPTTPVEARVAMTRLARTIGRDYRLWYGTSLRCNVIALDHVQRHLSQRYAGASLADPRTTSELLRHGALLSEIIARAVGGVWVDVGPTECGYWAMLVPPATRCWPIGRVYRFVALGHRERDLVAYYLDLEKRARGAGH
jgi:hypothetical protein